MPYYKVVEICVFKGEVIYCPCTSAGQFVAGETFRYKVGEWAYAKSGGFFVFDNLYGARTFQRVIAGTHVFEVEVAIPVNVPPLIISGFCTRQDVKAILIAARRSRKTLWQFLKSKFRALVGLHIQEPYGGTLCFRKVKPVRVVIQ